MKPIDRDRVRARILFEPGLPPLVQESDEGWTTALRLPALVPLTQGLAARNAPQHILDPFREPGEVLVHVDTKGQWPSAMQIINFSWLEEEHEALAAAVLSSIHRQYPHIRSTYDFLPEEDLPAVLPEIAAPEDLLPLLRLNILTIQAIDHASTPYLGFDFSCAWDEEHGLGVLTCGTEILEIGTADVSVDRAAAQEHRDALLARLRAQ
jgi:hypothetical protein